MPSFLRLSTLSSTVLAALVVFACGGNVSLGSVPGGATSDGGDDGGATCAESDCAGQTFTCDGGTASNVQCVRESGACVLRGDCSAEDPCAGKTFPKCPYACALGGGAVQGADCSDPGVTCRVTPRESGPRDCTCGSDLKWTCAPRTLPYPGCNQDCTVDTTDPCATKSFPACPRTCTQFPEQGACTDGDACRMSGSKIGDECTCSGGTWNCTVHPPLGLGCNLVCL